MSLIKIVKRILKRMPIRNVVLLESVPDVSDNTRAVFNEMVHQGINRKMKFIWLVEHDREHESLQNVKYFVRKPHSKLNLLKYTYYLYTSRCLISCNRSIGKERKEQTAFYLTHGTTIKSVHKYCPVSKNMDFILVASENVRELYSTEENFPLERVFALGYPRNDELTNCKIDLNNLLGTHYKKIIVWYPTYRQNKNSGGISTDVAAIPIIHNANAAAELNQIAKSENILIVMKPHFAQNISMIRKMNLSNIWFIDDNFFEKYHISSYQFVGNCDALLTDYSSIYYDYTLCDKPIAVIWEDIDEYRKMPGFAVDIDFMMQGAEKVYTLEELKEFIFRVSNGVDLLKDERNYIKEYTNYSDDGKNSERVVKFIIEHIDK